MTQAATKIQSLSRRYLARKTIKQNLEAPSNLPIPLITNILSFCPMPDITINKDISKGFTAYLQRNHNKKT